MDPYFSTIWGKNMLKVESEKISQVDFTRTGGGERVNFQPLFGAVWLKSWKRLKISTFRPSDPQKGWKIGVPVNWPSGIFRTSFNFQPLGLPDRLKNRGPCKLATQNSTSEFHLSVIFWGSFNFEPLRPPNRLKNRGPCKLTIQNFSSKFQLSATSEAVSTFSPFSPQCGWKVETGWLFPAPLY